MWSWVTVTVDLTNYPRITADRLCYFIADSLRVEQVRSITYDDQNIRFTVGVLRSFLHWTPVSTIFGGVVRFRSEPQRLRVVSRLSFYDTALFASLLVALLIRYDSRTALLVKADTFFYLYTWFGFVGGTMLFSMLRWRSFVRQCVKEAAGRVYLSQAALLADRADAALPCYIEPLDAQITGESNAGLTYGSCNEKITT